MEISKTLDDAQEGCQLPPQVQVPVRKSWWLGIIIIVEEGGGEW